MHAEIRFVMHPTDEAEFASTVRSVPGMVFVDGPKWASPQPPLAKDLQTAGKYLMIWSSRDTPPLGREQVRKQGAEWWYCNTEYFTIQFLRSGFQHGEPYLFEGQLAVDTTNQQEQAFHESSAPIVERRFRSLREWILQSYKNCVIIWQDPRLPRSQTNPQKPAADLWVGPHAIEWLRQAPGNRWIQEARDSDKRGYIVDLVGG